MGLEGSGVAGGACTTFAAEEVRLILHFLLVAGCRDSPYHKRSRRWAEATACIVFCVWKRRVHCEGRLIRVPALNVTRRVQGPRTGQPLSAVLCLVRCHGGRCMEHALTAAAAGHP